MKREFNLEMLYNKKAVVNCKTKEEKQEFLSFLDSKNIKWMSKSSIYDSLCIHQKNFDENTCFLLENKGLSYSNKIYFINKDYTILSLDDIVIKTKLNNFKEYGFTADFDGEIKFIDSFGHHFGICSWSNEMPTATMEDQPVFWINGECHLILKETIKKIPSRNLTPIKKEWYKNAESMFKLVIYQDVLYTLSRWYRDTSNVELIDINKAITKTVNVKDVRPATQEEILSLLIKE